MKCVASSGCGDRFSGNRTAEFGSLVDEVGVYVHKNPSWKFELNPANRFRNPDFSGKIRIRVRICRIFLATFIRATGRVSTKILGPIGAAVSELLARPAADVMNKEPIIGSKIGTYFRPQTPCRTDWAKFFCMGLWRGRLCMRLVQKHCFKRLPTP